MIKFLKKAGFVVSAGVAATPVFAAGIDTASVTADILAAGAAVAVIGGSVMTVMVGIKVFKWMRTAL